MTTNAKTNITYSLAYIHVPEAYSTLSYTHYYHTIPIALCIEQTRRRIIIYQLSHVYIYVHSTFGVITNTCKRHREIDGSIWKIRAKLAICNRLAKHDWLITNSLGKWNESSTDESLVLLWRLKILHIRYFM